MRGRRRRSLSLGAVGTVLHCRIQRSLSLSDVLHSKYIGRYRWVLFHVVKYVGLYRWLQLYLLKYVGRYRWVLLYLVKYIDRYRWMDYYVVEIRRLLSLGDATW